MQRFRPFTTASRVLNHRLQRPLPRGLLWSPLLEFPRIDYQPVSDDDCWSDIATSIFWNCAEPKSSDIKFVRAFFERRVDRYQTTLNWRSTIERAERSERKLWTMTILLGEAVVRFPSEHDRVLDLIDAIHEISASTNWQDRKPNSTLWSIIDLREVLWWSRIGPPSDECSYEWINACAFWARHAVRDLSEADDTFLMRVGVSSISEMLEIPRYEINLPACCQWLKIIGKDIYRLRHQHDAFDPHLIDIPYSKGKSEFLWTGKPGFSPERWQSWKERILKIRDLPTISVQGKRVADETVAEMNQIEATAEPDPPRDCRFGLKQWRDHQAQMQRDLALSSQGRCI